MVQGELFREEQSDDLRTSDGGSFFSRYKMTLKLDQVLIGSISVLVLFILTYSFGVERGKRSIESKLDSLIPSYGEILKTKVVLENVIAKNDVGGAQEEMVLLVGVDTVAVSKGSEADKHETSDGSEANVLPSADHKHKSDFTVQLVTYNSRDLAALEVNRLRLKGYEGFVIPSGQYFQVCVDYFSSRSKANSHLERFRSGGRYPDAYIRPVVR